MDSQIIGAVRALRLELHGLAERSGEETETKARLIRFLHENTALRIEDNGKWFCALHEEPGAEETVAFRADMDALPFGNGAAHHCGHDGHSAALAGLGLLLEGKRLGRNVLLIFQHAEETGEGGKICCRALEKHRASRVYAFHSIPGYPEGSVLLRNGVFACASRGLTVCLTGAASHAAYPDNGRNPGFAAARIISSLPSVTEPSRYGGLAMATLIGAEIGEKAFGTAAGNAEIWLTLRAWRDEDLVLLIKKIENVSLAEAARGGVNAFFSFCDVFPATVNDGETLEKLRKICFGAGLGCIDVKEPFRWSEDFGYYGALSKAVMVGIGAGEAWPQLHTESFEFNDRILPVALTLLSALALFG